MHFRAGLLVLLCAACSVGRSGEQGEPNPLETRPLELPQRTAHPPRSSEPPRVEPLALELPAVTFHLTTRLEDAEGGVLGEGVLLKVRRTTTAVHLHDRRAGEEWLFRRNSVDPARVYAERVLHSHRLVLHYTESDLRDEGLPSAFGPLALLGVDGETLAALRPDGREREQHGATFRCLLAADGGLEVWWSDELRLPLRVRWVTAAGHRVVQEILGLDREVDTDPLRDPGLRLPRYLRLDLCDWREEVCTCGGSHRPSLSGWARAR